MMLLAQQQAVEADLVTRGGSMDDKSGGSEDELDNETARLSGSQRDLSLSSGTGSNSVQILNFLHCTLVVRSEMASCSLSTW